jgi:hypothetical protein
VTFADFKHGNHRSKPSYVLSVTQLAARLHY